MVTPLEQLRAALADRYEIEREIGSGGMATVYLAKDYAAIDLMPLPSVSIS